MNNQQLGNLGCGCSVLAALFAVVATLPLLGWANWFTTLPLAIVAIAFSGLSLVNGRPYNTLAVWGFIGGVLMLFWAIFRLALGGGVI